MRLRSIVFVTDDDHTITVTNAEDWVVDVCIDTVKLGSIVCPKSRAVESWTAKIVSLVGFALDLSDMERRHLTMDLDKLLLEMS
jgi:hypothetical protein